jgi:predicted ATPase
VIVIFEIRIALMLPPPQVSRRTGVGESPRSRDEQRPARPHRALPRGRRPARVIFADSLSVMAEPDTIRTPDQRVRVFVSSALGELAAERRAVRDAVTSLRLVPVMFELGARPYPPRPVYRAYLAQSQVFVGIYWQSYGWVAPGEQVSGLEDEYELSAGLPRLIYVKSPAPGREPRLAQLLARIRDEGGVSYQHFSDPAELQQLVENDLAILLSERFEMTRRGQAPAGEAPLAGALPVPATPLLGRDQEAAALEDLVAREGVRLVTLTGPGGVGKTRLMLEAARRLGPGFADGARFVELAPVSAAEPVAPAIAAGLGLSTSAGQLTADLESYLRPRRVLLALDNFEQVLSAAPLVAGLLAAAPGLVVLTTSRAVLRLSGEHEFAVPPLPVPPAGAAPDPEQLRRYASVRLFTARARAVAPGFELTGANAAAVAEICRRLDGLPLAVELAAARVRLLPPQTLASRLGQRLSLLTGGARDLPERQQTLRNTLDWSFGLLSAGERALLARLGVFAGSFSLAAAEAVGAGSPQEGQAGQPGQVIDTLGALVDSSLVRAQTRPGEPRFSLLETIREYALERLREGGDWVPTHDRHAAYLLALAEPAAAELAGPGQVAWLDRLETEHDNLWAAMSWLVDHGPLDQAVHLSQVTSRFWWLRGHVAEYARLGDDFAAGTKDMSPYQQALALTQAGLIIIGNGDPARGRQLLEQALPLYRPDNARPAASVTMNALVLAVLGDLAALRRDYAAACRFLDQAQALLQELRDDDLTGYDRLQQQLTVALVDTVLGQVRLSQGDQDAAAQLFTDGLAVARRAQDWIPLLTSLYDLALARQAQGDLAGAAAHLHEGLALAAEAGDETSAAYYLEVLAAVAGQQDNPQRAVRLFAAARSILQTRGSGWLHAFIPRVPHDDAVLAELRSQMGDAAFAEAEAWGGSAGSKRAVEFALDQA